VLQHAHKVAFVFVASVRVFVCACDYVCASARACMCARVPEPVYLFVCLTDNYSVHGRVQTNYRTLG